MGRYFLAAAVSAALVIAACAPPANAAIVLSGDSYFQDFNAIDAGLPNGVTVRTGATSSSLGTPAAFNTTRTAWTDQTGGFKNYASTTGISPSANATTQANSPNRLPGVRQTATFGDPGAAFTFEFANTLGYQDFGLSFESHILSEQGRLTTWTVRWGTGQAPTSFTSLGTIAQDTFGKLDHAFVLDPTFSDSPETKWIQIAALSPSTGENFRDTFGIDNFQLTYTAVPEPTSLALVTVAGMLGLGGLRLKKRKAE
jgi:hypothetical protein